jgi:hypothetical protein
MRCDVEEWRAVPGYEGIYEASDMGRIKTLARRLKTWYGTRACHEKILKTPPDKRGYPKLALQKGRNVKWTTVHAVVARAFLGEPPKGHEVRHLDGNPSNCALSNLEYGTKLQNMRDQYRHGTRVFGERVGKSNLSQELAEWIRESSQVGPEIHAVTGISLSTISRIKRGVSYSRNLQTGG